MDALIAKNELYRRLLMMEQALRTFEKEISYLRRNTLLLEEPIMPPVASESIINVVQRVFQVSRSSLSCGVRTKPLVLPRHAAIYLMRTLLGHSMPHIGRIFKLHHTSVIHACASAAKRMEGDPEFARKIERCKQMLRTPPTPAPSEPEAAAATAVPIEIARRA
jgi:chromosomal replication initiation ATPase DnaA